MSEHDSRERSPADRRARPLAGGRARVGARSLALARSARPAAGVGRAGEGGKGGRRGRCTRGPVPVPVCLGRHAPRGVLLRDDERETGPQTPPLSPSPSPPRHSRHTSADHAVTLLACGQPNTREVATRGLAGRGVAARAAGEQEARGHTDSGTLRIQQQKSRPRSATRAMETAQQERERCTERSTAGARIRSKSGGLLRTKARGPSRRGRRCACCIRTHGHHVRRRRAPVRARVAPRSPGATRRQATECLPRQKRYRDGVVLRRSGGTKRLAGALADPQHGGAPPRSPPERHWSDERAGRGDQMPGSSAQEYARRKTPEKVRPHEDRKERKGNKKRRRRKRRRNPSRFTPAKQTSKPCTRPPLAHRSSSNDSARPSANQTSMPLLFCVLVPNHRSLHPKAAEGKPSSHAAARVHSLRLKLRRPAANRAEQHPPQAQRNSPCARLWVVGCCVCGGG